jgi:hypothetical protein
MPAATSRRLNVCYRAAAGPPHRTIRVRSRLRHRVLLAQSALATPERYACSRSTAHLQLSSGRMRPAPSSVGHNSACKCLGGDDRRRRRRDEQPEMLNALGCQHSQGYLHSCPVPTDDVERTLTPLRNTKVCHPSSRGIVQISDAPSGLFTTLCEHRSYLWRDRRDSAWPPDSYASLRLTAQAINETRANLPALGDISSITRPRRLEPVRVWGSSKRRYIM